MLKNSKTVEFSRYTLYMYVFLHTKPVQIMHQNLVVCNFIKQFCRLSRGDVDIADKKKKSVKTRTDCSKKVARAHDYIFVHPFVLFSFCFWIVCTTRPEISRYLTRYRSPPTITDRQR